MTSVKKLTLFWPSITSSTQFYIICALYVDDALTKGHLRHLQNVIQIFILFINYTVLDILSYQHGRLRCLTSTWWIIQNMYASLLSQNRKWGKTIKRYKMLFDNNVRGSSPWLAASITMGLWQNKGQCTKSHRGKTFLSLNV